VFWNEDSSGFYVIVDRLIHLDAAPASCEVTIATRTPPTLSITELTETPNPIPLPTTGGGWAPSDGDKPARMLAYERYTDDPNRFRIFIYGGF